MHSYLQKNIERDLTIVPVGKINIMKLTRLLEKHPKLFIPQREWLLEKKNRPICLVYGVVRNIENTYGMPCKYRRISRVNIYKTAYGRYFLA